MKARANQDLRFLAWGWPEARVTQGRVYECEAATNLPDHAYFLLTTEAGREDWVPVTADEVTIVELSINKQETQL